MENKGCSAEKPADGSCSTEKAEGACGGKSKCCPVTIFKGALVGGAVMFIWFTVSWTVLPWHKETTMALGSAHMLSANAERMAATFFTNAAPQPGIYELPKVVDTKTGAVGPAGVIKPYAFISVFPDGITQGGGMMKEQMGKYFLFCLLGAALLTKFLKKRKEGCCPVAGSMIVGLLVAVFSYLPNIIWFHFPWHYSLIGMADDVIAITLAGAAISTAVLKTGACTMGKSCGDKKEGACGSGGACCPVCKCSPCSCKTGSCGDKKTGSCGDKTGSCS